MNKIKWLLFCSVPLYCAQQKDSNKRIDLIPFEECLDGKRVCFVEKKDSCYIAATFGEGEETYSYFCYEHRCERHRVKSNAKKDSVYFQKIDKQYYNILKALFDKYNK